VATIVERSNSRAATAGRRDPTAELYYYVEGTEDETEVHATVQAAVPAYYLGLPFQNYQIRTEGGGIWEVKVNYAQRGLPAITFDTTGSKEKITQAKEHLRSYARADPNLVGPPPPAPDFKGAIGVTDDGVDGVEITLPRLGFTFTRYLPASEITGDYVRTLRGLTGCVNDAQFFGFDAGEVLFLGATGSQRGLEDVEINYRFEASLNREDLMVGDIGPITKGGWEYLWIRYESYEDKAAKRLVRRPASVHVERVYDAADFSQLGLGV